MTFGVLGPHRMTLAEPRDSGVPGCGMKRVHAGTLAQFPSERVFASARTDHEDLHAPSLLGEVGAQSSCRLLLLVV